MLLFDPASIERTTKTPGLFLKYLRRGSGYCVDVGACELIINGDIKLQSRTNVSHLTHDAKVLKSGIELPADLVVIGWGGRAEELFRNRSSEAAQPLRRDSGLLRSIVRWLSIAVLSCPAKLASSQAGPILYSYDNNALSLAGQCRVRLERDSIYG